MAHTQTAHTLARLGSSSRLPLGAALAVRIAGVLMLWDQRRRTRQALSALDDHLLQDVGLTPREARREAGRYFWQG